jgi:hypothetical protein
MPLTLLFAIASKPLIKAPPARIPIPIVTNTAMEELALDQVIADVTITLGVHLSKVMLPFSIARQALRETITADVEVSVVALTAMRVGATDGLVADIADDIDFPSRILGKIGEVSGIAAMALLCLAFICICDLVESVCHVPDYSPMRSLIKYPATPPAVKPPAAANIVWEEDFFPSFCRLGRESCGLAYCGCGG